MGSPKSTAALESLQLKPLKALLPEDGPDLKKVREAGLLVKTALDRAEISQKEAAITMGLTEAQLSMQLSGVPGNHLSWQRLQKLSDAFFVELLIVLAEYRGIAREERKLIFPARKVAK